MFKGVNFLRWKDPKDKQVYLALMKEGLSQEVALNQMGLIDLAPIYVPIDQMQDSEIVSIPRSEFPKLNKL